MMGIKEIGNIVESYATPAFANIALKVDTILSCAIALRNSYKDVCDRGDKNMEKRRLFDAIDRLSNEELRDFRNMLSLFRMASYEIKSIGTLLKEVDNLDDIGFTDEDKKAILVSIKRDYARGDIIDMDIVSLKRGMKNLPRGFVGYIRIHELVRALGYKAP